MPTFKILVTRHRVLGTGETLFFTVPAQKRGRAAQAFLSRDEVPRFDGDTAWCECEQVGRRVRVVRVLDG